MVSTTGEHHAYFELNEAFAACAVRPAGDAGGIGRTHRDGFIVMGCTSNTSPKIRCGSRVRSRMRSPMSPAAVHPSMSASVGGITFMVDVTRLPRNAFGYVPTPAPSPSSKELHAACSTTIGRWVAIWAMSSPCRASRAAASSASAATIRGPWSRIPRKDHTDERGPHSRHARRWPEAASSAGADRPDRGGLRLARSGTGRLPGGGAAS